MFENVKLSFRGIWSHKTRSFLTMLGIIIGIAAIIAIVSAIQGTNEVIRQNMMGNARHTVNVQLYQDDMKYEVSAWQPAPEGLPVYTEETRKSVLDVPNVLDAAFYRERSEWDSCVFYGDSSLTGCRVLGIDDNYFPVTGYAIRRGRSRSTSSSRTSSPSTRGTGTPKAICTARRKSASSPASESPMYGGAATATRRTGNCWRTHEGKDCSIIQKSPVSNSIATPPSHSISMNSRTCSSPR